MSCFKKKIRTKLNAGISERIFHLVYLSKYLQSQNIKKIMAQKIAITLGLLHSPFASVLQSIAKMLYSFIKRLTYSAVLSTMHAVVLVMKLRATRIMDHTG